MDVYNFEWIAKNNEEISALMNSVTPKTSCHRHRHEFYEFVYILGGTGYHTIDCVDYEVREGNVVLVNPKEVHAVFTSDYFTNGGKLEYIDLYLSKKLIEDQFCHNLTILDLLNGHKFKNKAGESVLVSPVITFTDDRRDFISTVFINLYQEYSQKHSLYQEIMQDLAFTVIHLILRNIAECDGKILNNIGAIPQAVTEYIEAHFTEKITLKETAALAHMQPSNFCKQFKKYYKTSFVKYIHKRRIETAVDMIKRGYPNIKIYAVAQQVGYASPQQFYQYFRQYVGCTPTEYCMKIKKS